MEAIRMELKCGLCGGTTAVITSQGGETVKCSKCGEMLSVPHVSAQVIQPQGQWTPQPQATQPSMTGSIFKALGLFFIGLPFGLFLLFILWAIVLNWIGYWTGH